ncbi:MULTISPECIES: HD domain-containing protein [unclassified Fusibacter]|uniref:HD domain-containing protein n=1 Tax=unclassified Fusibacter TaxID=2624464 RepID=UPI0013E91C53|nr:MULTISPECIES: HD domain-containing protein [unclassified Fusibacter]MCK8059921.1 HD domain-containing protein [Fusibacter sp. A2]NPE22063.1 hypothetical protein [Fusibacter sp. A1]
MIDMTAILIKEAVANIRKLNHDSALGCMWFAALSEKNFSDGLSKMINRCDYSGRSLVELFLAFDNQTAISADEWISAIYQFALCKSYPQTAVIPEIDGLEDCSVVFLELFRLINQVEKKSSKESYISRYPFELLLPQEVKDLENTSEYEIIQESFRFDYIYEMMKLNKEVSGHATLEHITGVHYLALYIARQLKKLGLPVDLGIVSGAAALHDIGKFGCKPEEKSKVAYFHYYYSDEWFYRKNIKYIRNIAVNHSTWDLELEHLSLESLVLIYSDFRVKRHKDPNWPYAMKFFNIDDSFDIILDKLDNVDKKKEKRYRKVYEKLKDFEDYMLYLGVNVQFDKRFDNAQEVAFGESALLTGSEIVKKYKKMAIAHNILLMNGLRTEESLMVMLDEARIQKTAQDFRRYMHLLEQFSKYLTPAQKMITLKFLFSMLNRFEEDIRKQAAGIMGTIIASFDDPYSKYLPPTIDPNVFKLSKSGVLRSFVNEFLNPENIHSKQKEEWVGYALSDLIRKVVRHSKEIVNTVDLVIEKLSEFQGERRLYLLRTIIYFPVSRLSDDQLSKLTLLVSDSLDSSYKEVKLLAMECIYHLSSSKNKAIVALATGLMTIDEQMPYESFMASKINKRLHVQHQIENHSEFGFNQISTEQISYMYLSNLKTATAMTVKKLHIEMILKHMLTTENADKFYAAIHYCNLIKNSVSHDIRILSGKALVTLTEKLTKSQINEVAIELLRGLEIESYQFSKIIPGVLGRILMLLERDELIELLDDLKIKVKMGSTALKMVIVETIGHGINAALMIGRKSKVKDDLIKEMLGIILSGLVQYDSPVHSIAFNTITNGILSSKVTNLSEKQRIYQLLHKKMLTILDESSSGLLEPAMDYAFGLNKLYAFINEYIHEKGGFTFESDHQVAYFPGTFDPFSLGQKSVARHVRDAGFDVYIAIDPFNWMRRTQPTLLRRKLINMTIADEFGVYLFPRNKIINLNMEDSSNRLSDLFPEQPVHLVTGEDMLLSNASYMNEDSHLFDLPHIVVSRGNLTKKKKDQALKVMDGIEQVTHVNIMVDLERITPDQIRRAIDLNWDLTDVMDPLASRAIRKFDMYKNEPQFKNDLEPKTTEVLTMDGLSESLKKELQETFHLEVDSLLQGVVCQQNCKRKIILIKGNNPESIIGVGIYRGITENEFEAMMNHDSLKADYVDLYVENTALIEVLVAIPETPLHNNLLMLQTELLVSVMSQGYEYCYYKVGEGMVMTDLLKVLRTTGFTENKELRIMMCSLKNPVVIILDAQSMLKDDYRKDKSIRNSMSNTRDKLLYAVVSRHPNQVVLAFDRGMMYDQINQMISHHNVPLDDTGIGASMCVPYGELFKRWRLPHSVTKALHTERVYDQKLRYFDVKPYPYYLSIEEQTAIIKAFNKPVILIDDLLDKGLRLQAIEMYFKNEKVSVDSIIVGIMSRRGRKRIEQKGYRVHAAYNIPNLSAWYTESMLYPFIGGDSLWLSEEFPPGNMPSVNKILPYMVSKNDYCRPKRSYVDFSLKCLNNSHSLLKVIEERYEAMNRRPFTIERLSEVFITPRIPQYGKALSVDVHVLPSQMVESDIIRLEHLLKLFEE